MTERCRRLARETPPRLQTWIWDGTSARATLRREDHAKGRKLGERCTVKAKKGKRCTLKLVKKRIAVLTRPGAKTVKLTTTGLKPGTYTVTVTARDRAGNVSRASTVTLTVKKQATVKAKRAVHRL